MVPAAGLDGGGDGLLVEERAGPGVDELAHQRIEQAERLDRLALPAQRGALDRERDVAGGAGAGLGDEAVGAILDGVQGPGVAARPAALVLASGVERDPREEKIGEAGDVVCPVAQAKCRELRLQRGALGA